MIEVRLNSGGLDLEFQAGTGLTALYGPSESGKTLILDAIAGFTAPQRGRILLDDALLFDGAAGVNLPPRRRACGYVARDWALFPHMTLQENLIFPLVRLRRLERHRRVKEMLERFALHEFGPRRLHETANTVRLRFAVARALITEPKLLLVDEPGGGFDTALRAAWIDSLRLVRDETEVPILLATRDLDTCFELAGHMLVLEGGRILQAGPPRKVLDQPASVEAARALGIRNIFSAEILALDPGRNTSRLRLENFELTGPYFPGRLRGDRVSVLVQAGDLRVVAQNGSKPQPNQIAAPLERVAETSGAVRLEFAGPIVVEVPRLEFERQKDNKEWYVEFPPQALKIL
ncbi:MAG: ATP-binding cassette domain-containing protein [Bryobacteraceae bacterium]